MQLVFARHGLSTANERRIISNRHLPHFLTEVGRTQARDLAQRLAQGGPIARIYASPIPRARETAEILAGDQPVTTSNALREVDCGVVEGRDDEEAWSIHDAVERAWAQGNLGARVEGGESLIEVEARFTPFVKEVVEQHASTPGMTVVVSHGTVLLEMLPRLLANVERQWAGQVPLGNCDVVRVQVVGQDLICSSWAGVNIGPPLA